MEISAVTFSENYARQRQNYDAKEIAKLEEAIRIHGYRGASKKKHNGVVPIRPSDAKFWKFLEPFALTNEQFPVKVVAHVPAGHRLIGYLQKQEEHGTLTLHILGVCQY